MSQCISSDATGFTASVLRVTAINAAVAMSGNTTSVGMYRGCHERAL